MTPPDPRIFHAWPVILSGICLLGSFAVISRIYRDIQRRDQSGASSSRCMDVCNWSLGDIGMILGWTVFVYSQAALLGMLFGRLKIFRGPEGHAFFMLTTGVLIYAVMVALIARLLRRKKLTWGKAFGFQTGPWFGILAGVGASFVALIAPYVLAGFATNCFFKFCGWEIEPQPILEIIGKLRNPWLLGGMGALALVGAPIVEELFFRGVLYPCLKKRVGRAHSLWMTSAIFAEFHFHLPGFLPLFVLGAIFTILYEWKGNLLACILCHSLFNALSLCFLFFQGKG